MTLRVQHLAPLIVFFIMGLSAIDSVAMTFYVRDHLSLTAAQLIEIGIWCQLPWSIKIAFGSLIDSFLLFGNNRRSYIYLGAGLMFLGILWFLAFVAGVSPLHSEYTNLLVSGLLQTTGIVFAQSTANALAIELVEEGTPQIGYMQVGTRLAVSLGAVLAAVATGYLAASYTMVQIALIRLTLPVVLAVVTAIALHRNSVGTKALVPQWRMLGLSLLFTLFCLVTRSQVAIFLAQMVVINYLLWRLTGSMVAGAAKTFLLSCLAIFLFRVSPDVGPGFSWWMLGDLAHGGLAFDPIYMGHLRIVSTVVDILALSVLAKVMARGKIFRSLSTLTVIGVLTSIPAILVYYGLHTRIGASVHSIFLVDTAFSAPLADLSMIPLGILIAMSAPAEGRAMYMAVTASFMNMALLGGDLMTKGLNMVYTVTRTDYSQLGGLLLSSTGIGLALSVVGLLILYKVERVKYE